MELVKDIAGSPLVFLLLAGCVVGWLIFLRLFRTNRCPRCRRGRLLQVEAKTLDVKQHMYHGSRAPHSSMQLITEVKYRCDRCGEHLSVTENR